MNTDTFAKEPVVTVETRMSVLEIDKEQMYYFLKTFIRFIGNFKNMFYGELKKNIFLKIIFLFFGKLTCGYFV